MQICLKHNLAGCIEKVIHIFLICWYFPNQMDLNWNFPFCKTFEYGGNQVVEGQTTLLEVCDWISQPTFTYKGTDSDMVLQCWAKIGLNLPPCIIFPVEGGWLRRKMPRGRKFTSLFSPLWYQHDCFSRFFLKLQSYHLTQKITLVEAPMEKLSLHWQCTLRMKDHFCDLWQLKASFTIFYIFRDERQWHHCRVFLKMDFEDSGAKLCAVCLKYRIDWHNCLKEAKIIHQLVRICSKMYTLSIWNP